MTLSGSCGLFDMACLLWIRGRVSTRDSTGGLHPALPDTGRAQRFIASSRFALAPRAGDVLDDQ